MNLKVEKVEKVEKVVDGVNRVKNKLELLYGK